MIIDSDTHVNENPDTWSYLDGFVDWYAPQTLQVVGDRSERSTQDRRHFWFFGDGTLRPRRFYDDAQTGTTEATRHLTDVRARLRHMDQLGTDLQVIYPTLFLHTLTDRADVEVGLCHAYNRWLAERCAESDGRLKWIAMVPVLDVPAGVTEVLFAKERGAVGVMKKGLELSRAAGDPYFYPIYEAASELGLAVLIHTASGDGDAYLTARRPARGMWPLILPTLDACSSLLVAEVPSRFPKLRVGFIEAGAGWVPYVLNYVWGFVEQRTRDMADRPQQAAGISDVFRENRFYVAYQTSEDLPYLLQYGLEDCLVIGTDYSHMDQSANLGMLREMRDRGELNPVVVRKMLDDNPRALYGL